MQGNFNVMKNIISPSLSQQRRINPGECRRFGGQVEGVGMQTQSVQKEVRGRGKEGQIRGEK